MIEDVISFAGDIAQTPGTQHAVVEILVLQIADQTGRFQTVDRESNSRYYGVIEAFGKRTGVPVLLNTSFNRQEPIVARPEEAISCFLRTDMDVLVLGDYYSTDRNPGAIQRACESFTGSRRAA